MIRRLMTHLPKSRWPWAILGAGGAFAAMGAGGLITVEAGLFDARASTPHDPFTAWATHTGSAWATRPS